MSLGILKGVLICCMLDLLVVGLILVFSREIGLIMFFLFCWGCWVCLDWLLCSVDLVDREEVEEI